MTERPVVLLAQDSPRASRQFSGDGFQPCSKAICSLRITRSQIACGVIWSSCAQTRPRRRLAEAPGLKACHRRPGRTRPEPTGPAIRLSPDPAASSSEASDTMNSAMALASRRAPEETADLQDESGLQNRHLLAAPLGPAPMPGHQLWIAQRQLRSHMYPVLLCTAPRRTPTTACPGTSRNAGTARRGTLRAPYTPVRRPARPGPPHTAQSILKATATASTVRFRQTEPTVSRWPPNVTTTRQTTATEQDERDLRG